MDWKELLFKVTDPGYKGTAADNWNGRIAASIIKEKAEAAKKHNIRFGRTEVHCGLCGKIWPNRCAHSSVEKVEFNRPGRSRDEYREELGMEVGMAKEEALSKFLGWRDSKKTCQRCGGEEYVEFCPLQLICKEAVEWEQEKEAEEVIEDGKAKESRETGEVGFQETTGYFAG